MDDFLLFADDKTTLWDWKSALEDELARYRLTIHPGAQPRPTTEGIPFLGFHIFPDRRRLKRRKGVQYRRKLKGLMDQYQRGEISMDTMTASVRGWVNHLRYGNTVGLRKKILGAQPIPSPQFPPEQTDPPDET